MGGILAAVKNKLRPPRRRRPPLSACPPNPERIMAAAREHALQIGGIRIYLSRTKLTDAFENNVLEPEHYGDPITNGQLSHVARAVYHSAGLPSPSRPAAFSRARTSSQLECLFSVTYTIGCISMAPKSCSVRLVN